jgi:hypothetical protein
VVVKTVHRTGLYLAFEMPDGTSRTTETLFRRPREEESRVCPIVSPCVVPDVPQGHLERTIISRFVNGLHVADDARMQAAA